jgi:hypothetical protein
MMDMRSTAATEPWERAVEILADATRALDEVDPCFRGLVIDVLTAPVPVPTPSAGEQS